tara:strand:+ start:85 stop:369 length:285 start_codon:yes stop_codon:yes gene_type:complete
MNKNLIYGVAGILCVVAVLPLPYGFYTFLRLSVTISGVIASLELKKEENFLWILFAGISLLFNPVFPIYLDRGIGFPIDLFVAGSFGWIAFRNA